MSQPPDPKVRFKRRTAEGWEETNPLLKRGEPGYETDTGKVKIGDGETHWVDLEYVGDALIADLVERVTLLEEANGGGGGGGLPMVEVTLNRAQIQALPVTPFPLVPPTETDLYYDDLGIKTIPIVLGAAWATQIGTAYAGFHPTSVNQLILNYGADNSQQVAVAVETDIPYPAGVLTTKSMDMKTVMSYAGKTFFGRFQSYANMADLSIPSFADNGLYVRLARNIGGPTGPLTGGKADDFLKLKVWYDILTVR